MAGFAGRQADFLLCSEAQTGAAVARLCTYSQCFFCCFAADGGGDGPQATGTQETTDATTGPETTTDETTPPTTDEAGPSLTDCLGGACISDASLNGDAIEVTWEAVDGTVLTDDLNAPGTNHVHFYFEGQNRGVGEGDGSTQWNAIGPSQQPFTGRTLSEAQGLGVSQLCVILAAGGEHTVVEGTGNCVDVNTL